MMDEINSEIAKLESQPASYQNIERLAWLYIVRDHLTDVHGEMPTGNSEYFCACSGKSIGEVMMVMDELMDALAVIQPRLYHAVLVKLNPV